MVPGMGVWAGVCFFGGMRAATGFINVVDRANRLAHPVQSATFFDWMCQSDRSVEKVRNKPDLVSSRKRPISTHGSDRIIIGLTSI